MFLQGCNLSYDKIYDNLAEMELEFPPGQEPQYSNLGFAILGRTLEKFLGTSWEAFSSSVTILSPTLHTGARPA